MNAAAPLSKVLKTVASITGYDAVLNRGTLVEKINGVLSMLYRNEDTRLNYFQVEDCTLACFNTEHCQNEGLKHFLGVVIPAGVRNIHELRVNDTMLEITAKRVPIRCAPRYVARGCPPAAEHLRPRLLEKDIPACGSRRVAFSSTSKQDEGCLVGVRYADLNGSEVREDIVLSPSPMSTSTSVAAFLEITFPERCGFIIVSSEEGDILGKYHPSIYEPVHEWFRLATGCAGMKVGYRALREPYPVVFDTDKVPFSDIVLWRMAIQCYNNLDSMELTNSQASQLNRLWVQLAEVSNQDLNSKNLNFTHRLMPDTSEAVMATGRYFSRRR